MKGIGVSDGIGLGQVLVYEKVDINIEKKDIEDCNLEIKKLEDAIKKTKSEIERLYELTLKKMGKEEADIFIAHKMLLDDPEYIGSIKEKIRNEKINSEWAIKEVTDFYINIFTAMDDGYIKERIADLKDVANGILRKLLNIENKDLGNIEKATIIVAKDLTPSDTAQINKDKIAGIVTEIGGKTAHTAIMARTMNIAAVSGIENIRDRVKDGDFIIVDGFTGSLIVKPSQEEIETYTMKRKLYQEKKKAEKKMIGLESISQDGYKVEIAGNIGGLEDLDQVLNNDGEGVGLFRTEFLYMNNDKLPTEEEQFQAYRSVAEKLEGRPLVIRTLDVGGDKEIPYLNIPKEMNPFLGYRAIRFCLSNKEIFKTQLRAILRASVYGDIKIMFPMISSIEELSLSKSILEEVKEELRQENIRFDEKLEIGIMVEIPAVAINSKAFAKEVDFFSIGTNDLIQYTLAVDRGNGEIVHLYDQFNPAVLNLINMTIKNGHEAGIWVGMCGEVAGDPKLIPVLLAMGLDEFSMNPSSILEARSIIRRTSNKEIEAKLDELLSLPSGKDVERFIDDQIIKTRKSRED